MEELDMVGSEGMPQYIGFPLVEAGGAAQVLPSEGARADTPRTVAHAAAGPAAPHPVPADGTTPSGLQCLPDRAPWDKE